MKNIAFSPSVRKPKTLMNGVFIMRCSNCGMCCEGTEMLLSKEDIKRLEREGFIREDFTVTGGDGLIRLRNVGEWCYFYDPEEKKNARNSLILRSRLF